jgi:hypothetical protein
MIRNASSIPLSANPGTLPDVSGALADWFQPLTFTQIVKTVVNYQAVETETSTTFMGVRQPFSAQQLLMRPEGQRKWKWETIHAYPDLTLDVDDIITFSGVKYRVMQKSNWAEYGYVEYAIVEDYTE